MTRITKEELSPSLVQEIENTVDLTPIETRLTNVESKTTVIGDVSTLVTPIKTDAVAGVNSHILPRTGDFAKHSYYVPNPVITGDVLDISYIADFSTLTTAGQLSGVAFNITFIEEKTAVQFYIKVNDTLTFMLQNKTSEAFVKFEAGTMYTFVCTGTTFLLARGGNGGGSGTGNTGNVNNSTWLNYQSSFRDSIASPYDTRGVKGGDYIEVIGVAGQLVLKRYKDDSLASQQNITQSVPGVNVIQYINCVSDEFFEIVLRNQANQNIWDLYRIDMNLNVLKTFNMQSGQAATGNLMYVVGFIGENHLLGYVNGGSNLVVLSLSDYVVRANVTGIGTQNVAHLRKVAEDAWIYTNTSSTPSYALFKAINNTPTTGFYVYAQLKMFGLLNHIAQLSGQ